MDLRANANDGMGGAKRRLVMASLLATILTLATLFLTGGHWLTNEPDSPHYIDMAHGENSAKPFANRILHPLIVRGLSAWTYLSTDRAFLITDITALFTFFAAVGYILLRFTRRPLVLAVFLLSPFSLQLFQNGYLPDLPHAALLAIFFALLAEEKKAGALVFLFLLMLTRESTVLLSAVLMFVAYRRAEPGLLLRTAVVTATGMAVVSLATRSAAGNIHDASTPLYLLLKMPFNFSKNVLGIAIWSNTLESHHFFTPIMIYELPRALRVGSIRSIGYAGFHPEFPLFTLAVLLTQYGVAPAILWKAWRKCKVTTADRGQGGTAPARQPPTAAIPSECNLPSWTSVALLYGTISFLLAPALGSSVWRLVGYGWPAMLLAAPILLIRSGRMTPALLILQASTVCVGFLVSGQETAPWAAAPVILLGTCGQALTLWSLRDRPLRPNAKLVAKQYL